MAGQRKLFDKYLFRKALRCPTKLFYTAHTDVYPRKSFYSLFGKHNARMRRKLELIAHEGYPKGQYAGKDFSGSAAVHTGELLKKDKATIYHAEVNGRRCRAHIPILSKAGNNLTIGMVRLKSTVSNRINQGNFDEYARSRWRRYLMEFAFLKWVTASSFSPEQINCHLILPDKSYKSKIDCAYQKLIADTDSDNKRLENLMTQEEQQEMQSLLITTDVTKLVDDILQGSELPVCTETELDELNFIELVKYLRDLWQSGEKYDPPIGKRCGRCEFRIPEGALSGGESSGFAECWSNQISSFTNKVNEDHILSLKGHGKKEYIRRGIYDIGDITIQNLNVNEEKISDNKGTIAQAERQYFRIKKAKNQQVPREIIKPALFEELDRWRYPLHFVDFEAATLPVPIRRGGRAYEQLLFQFSCHTLTQKGSISHHQWLETEPGKFPNFEMVKAFQKIPQIEEGTLVQYSKFEKTAFKKIRKQLVREEREGGNNTELLEWIHRLISRPDSNKQNGPYFADLQRLIKQYYHNFYMNGAMSLKDVLAAVFKISGHLKKVYQQPYSSANFSDFIWWKNRDIDNDDLPENPYNLLDYEIGDGADAFAVYGELQERGVSDSKRKIYHDALRKYCELDTLAMLMIFQHWQAKMEMIKTD